MALVIFSCNFYCEYLQAPVQRNLLLLGIVFLIKQFDSKYVYLKIRDVYFKLLRTKLASKPTGL